MNRKAQGVMEKAAVFLGLWLIASIVWAFWLDGINVPLAGCLTSIGVVSVLNITIGRK